MDRCKVLLVSRRSAVVVAAATAVPRNVASARLPSSMALPLCSLLLGSVPVAGLVLWCMTFAQMSRAVNALSTSPTR